jgi:DNA-binding NtrC family response regulator
MLIRATLALDNAKLQTELSRALRKRDMLVSVLKSGDPLTILRKEPCDLLITDEHRLQSPLETSIPLVAQLPDSPIILLLVDKEDETRRVALLAAGCDAVLTHHLSSTSLIEAIETILLKRTGTPPEALSERRLLAEPRLTDFVSHSQPMQAFMNIAGKMAKTDSSLLILGETGVGKERLALAIHAEGNRSSGPFIPINCAALPDNLLESELFGHEEGAFTGATRTRRGAFELAHKGTVFLDEIGDMPLQLQVKLLRVLQDRQFAKLGGEKTIKVDVRIMAATNRNLQEEIEKNRFRRDLYYRLSVMTLLIPPLRERREDIPELVQSYIGYLAPRIGVTVDSIGDEALAALEKYPWPGNVRELINVIERAMLLCEGQTIRLCDLPDEISKISQLQGKSSQVSAAPGEAPLPEPWLSLPWREVKQKIVDRFESSYFDSLLKKSGGRIAQASKTAGMTSRATYDKMKKHGIDKKSYK